MALIKQMTAEILTELGPADAHDHEGSCNPAMPRAMRRKMQADAKMDAKVRRACQAWSARAAGAKPRHDPRRPGHAPWYVAGGEPDIAWPTAASDQLGDRLAHAQALVRWRRSIDWQRARLLALFQGGLLISRYEAPAARPRRNAA